MLDLFITFYIIIATILLTGLNRADMIWVGKATPKDMREIAWHNFKVSWLWPLTLIIFIGMYLSAMYHMRSKPSVITR